ncbi:MAG: isoprenylcysteine carboxylmethyltransferase family protein [Ignavibacteriales bacterium]|nr:MAG: isoprenylcysteine carboxylmethyltransferase family protein [Ignavibacteriales bacterium]
MDPINILFGINLVATFGANISGAAKGIKTAITNVKEKPKTFLQKLPPNLSVVILILVIASVFQLGTLDYSKYPELQTIRIAGLIMYVISSWFQIWAYRTMGDNYSNEIVILKNHKLVKGGPFKLIRHPYYLGQIFADLGAVAALLSYTVLILIIIEIPLLVMRSLFEDKLLMKHFKEEFTTYKKKTGLLIPFIG